MAEFEVLMGTADAGTQEAAEKGRFLVKKVLDRVG